MKSNKLTQRMKQRENQREWMKEKNSCINITNYCKFNQNMDRRMREKLINQFITCVLL